MLFCHTIVNYTDTESLNQADVNTGSTILEGHAHPPEADSPYKVRLPQVCPTQSVSDTIQIGLVRSASPLGVDYESIGSATLNRRHARLPEVH